MKSVGYNEYFKSQQTGKVVERKCDVHKADYEGEDTVELGGKAYFVLKTYDIDDDTVELTLTDLYIAIGLLGYREREAWRKTPYQIVTLFKYHKEYNPHIFRQERAAEPTAAEEMDDIDKALGGL